MRSQLLRSTITTATMVPVLMGIAYLTLANSLHPVGLPQPPLEVADLEAGAPSHPAGATRPAGCAARNGCTATPARHKTIARRDFRMLNMR